MTWANQRAKRRREQLNQTHEIVLERIDFIISVLISKIDEIIFLKLSHDPAMNSDASDYGKEWLNQILQFLKNKIAKK